MARQIHLLDTFPARGSDGSSYKVCAYEQLARDDTVHDGQEHWLPTGVTEFRLDSGAVLTPHRDGSWELPESGITLKRAD